MICCNYFPPTLPLPSSGPCLKLCILLLLRVELLVFLNFAYFPWVSGPWLGYKALLSLTLVPITGPDPDPLPAGACPSPALERCTGLSWSPFSCLAPSWGCGTDPDPREPLAPTSVLKLSSVWPLFSSFILGSILLFHSMKPLFTFPKVSFTLVWILVLFQLLQKFVSLCSDLRHKHDPKSAPVLCIKMCTKILVSLTFSLKHLCQAFIWCAGLFQLL